MGLGVLDLDRQEGPGSNMQCQRFMAHSALGQPDHQLGGKMQRRCGRSNGAFPDREHCLVIEPIRFIGTALLGDIGGQRHGSGAFEQNFDWLVTGEGQRPAAIIMPRFGKG